MRLASGSPIPMTTTFVICSPFASSRSIRKILFEDLARRQISALNRACRWHRRHSPSRSQLESRCRSFAGPARASARIQSVARRSVPAAVFGSVVRNLMIGDTSGKEREFGNQCRAQCGRNVVHCRKVVDAMSKDPSPNLLGSILGKPLRFTPRPQPGEVEFVDPSLHRCFTCDDRVDHAGLPKGAIRRIVEGFRCRPSKLERAIP